MMNIIELLGLFLCLFFIFAIIIFLLINTFKDSYIYYKLLTIILFTVLLVFGNTFINIFFLNKINPDGKNKCNMSNTRVFFNTVYTILFVTLPALLLLYFTNISSIFSNSLYFNTDIFNKNNNEHDKLYAFYQDPILLIQEFEDNDTMNYDNLKIKLYGLTGVNLSEEDYNKIRKIIMKKELIGYFIWLFFIGSISLIISYNTILVECINL